MGRYFGLFEFAQALFILSAGTDGKWNLMPESEGNPIGNSAVRARDISDG
jgi:hypothetical protein